MSSGEKPSGLAADLAAALREGNPQETPEPELIPEGDGTDFDAGELVDSQKSKNLVDALAKLNAQSKSQATVRRHVAAADEEVAP